MWDEIEGEEGETEMLEMEDAGLPVTQSDDPRSGGHFALGVSKAPPRPSRERGRVEVLVVRALDMAHRKDARLVVEVESPISNGLTTVGGAKTRFVI